MSIFLVDYVFYQPQRKHTIKLCQRNEKNLKMRRNQWKTAFNIKCMMTLNLNKQFQCHEVHGKPHRKSLRVGRKKRNSNVG